MPANKTIDKYIKALYSPDPEQTTLWIDKARKESVNRVKNLLGGIFLRMEEIVKSGNQHDINRVESQLAVVDRGILFCPAPCIHQRVLGTLSI